MKYIARYCLKNQTNKTKPKKPKQTLKRDRQIKVTGLLGFGLITSTGVRLQVLLMWKEELKEMSQKQESNWFEKVQGIHQGETLRRLGLNKRRKCRRKAHPGESRDSYCKESQDSKLFLASLLHYEVHILRKFATPKRSGAGVPHFRQTTALNPAAGKAHRQSWKLHSPRTQ